MVKKEISISEIGGFQIGHADDKEGVTGCTVLLFDECAPAGVDIRGGLWPSRETPLLNPLPMQLASMQFCSQEDLLLGWMLQGV